jgi:6-phosphogluconolactonase
MMRLSIGGVVLAVAGLSVTLIACTSEERAMSRSAAEAPAPETPLSFYVGTYTDGESLGIYRFTLDPASGAASDPVLAVEVENPSFLALHPNGRFLYAVGEMGEFRGEKTGAVSAFAIDSASGDLTVLNQQPSMGTGPCHLVVDARGRVVLVANYGSGTVAVLPLGDDGRLGEPSSVQSHSGTGPNERRQEGPHAHGIALDAEERRAFVADLGADRLFVYDLDAAAGALAPSDPPVPAVALEPGAGPRHVVFDPRGEVLYSINELDSTVTVLRYDAASGGLEKVQTTTTLPDDFEGENSTAEIAISPDGRFLYGSNRGHDSLAVFAVDPASGRLTLVGHVSTGGHSPRHFAIDPTGGWLLAANQRSDSVVPYRLDPESGMPAAAGPAITVPSPVCVLPVPAAP